MFWCAHIHVFASSYICLCQFNGFHLSPFRVCCHSHVASPLALASRRTCLATSAYSCSSNDAIVWFKEPDEADRLTAWKVKTTIFTYVVALQIYLSVAPPWLRVCSQTPSARTSQSTSSHLLCCGAVGAACSEECVFIALQISCNGSLRWWVGGDYADNYINGGMSL